jgi:hypothetical protein
VVDWIDCLIDAQNSKALALALYPRPSHPDRALRRPTAVDANCLTVDTGSENKEPRFSEVFGSLARQRSHRAADNESQSWLWPGANLVLDKHGDDADGEQYMLVSIIAGSTQAQVYVAGRRRLSEGGV